jgi:3-phenylpropionate/trans-cinnamate dioxygenase ferredoxin reductase subunit
MEASTQHPEKIVIVGAGHGGGTVASLLRQRGFRGEVVLIGTEPAGPYHRPPLSKNLLKGDLRLPLAPETFYADNEIELRTETHVASIDRSAGCVTLADGETVSYDVLVLATGARARQLPIPGIDLRNVYELRTIAHAEVLAEVLTPGAHLAIVGGGWIGLEVAASARDADVTVTVLEREERLLARVAGTALSTFLTDYHRDRGVTIVTAATVQALAPDDGDAVRAVVLADGAEIEADHVLVGVGAVAEDDLASACGLACADGVIVDYAARTDDPAIFAVGDATRRPLAGRPDLYRLESIPSTVEQARQAVAAILGEPAPGPEVPWFWSDQYDLKLRIAGLIAGADTVTVRADGAHGKLAMFHSRDGHLVALEGVNAGAEFTAARQMLRDNLQLDLEALADPSVPLNQTTVPPLGSSVPTSELENEDPAEVTNVFATTDAPDAVPELPPGPGGEPGHPLATFIQTDGSIHSVKIPAGSSLMEGSISHNLPGIIAECGGMCSCGTCHVYIDEPWAGLLPEPEYEEDDLLEFIEHKQDNSRLSCQLIVTDELDGIVVRVAEYS